ncbi:MAG: hypothetical protein WCO99_15790, partial [Planctomycetota bacterium]
MTQKLLATCVAAAAIAGAAAAGITAAVSIKPSASPAVKPVVFGAPLPLDPATDPVAAARARGASNDATRLASQAAEIESVGSLSEAE